MLYYIDLELCSITSEAGLGLQELLSFICVGTSYSTKCLALRFIRNHSPKAESGTRDLIWADKISVIRNSWAFSQCLVTMVCPRIKFGAVAFPRLALPQKALYCAEDLNKLSHCLGSLSCLCNDEWGAAFLRVLWMFMLLEWRTKGSEGEGWLQWASLMLSYPAVLTLRCTERWEAECRHFHWPMKSK